MSGCPSETVGDGPILMGSHMLLYGKSESTVSRGVSLFWVLLCSVSKLDSTLAKYIL